MRDDFSKPTKELIAKKVGYLCSKPDCQKPTIGSTADGNGIINVGVASHIVAAASGGPRSDASLSSEQRKHESNGLWLCQTHSKLIDSDTAHYTLETLRGWKDLAEKRAFESLAYTTGDAPAQIIDIAPHTDDAFIKQLNLEENESIESVTISLLQAAQNDLTSFKNITYWPQHPISLGLKLIDGDNSNPFEVANLALINEHFNEITVIAPPGTGKTTTLLQFVEAILSQNKTAAVFFPLSEWASGTESLLQSLLNRRSFKGLKQEHFFLMAHHGRLALILDGWNELGIEAKKRVSSEIKSLRRDYPAIRIIISTRQHEIDLPLSGPVVKIDTLTEKQQSEIALALRGSDGEALLDHAWRTPGIRELIAIPLYLTALLSQTTGDKLPTTKEEVLRMFVSNHENEPERAAILKDVFLGTHKAILIALAASATHSVATAISDTHARVEIKSVIDKLIQQGQIASPIEPAKAIETLVNLHMIVRADDQDGTISFQHQQFQEWYGSFVAEELMLSAVKGNAYSLKDLRVRILDKPIWEEQILFACERLSRSDQNGIDAVAYTILETLSIDPILSAEMIYRSSEEVWEKVKNKIFDFVGKWHTPAHIDRALTFMINSGRSEFSEKIWPLLENEDTQVHLRAIRAGHLFRPSVLGNDVHKRIEGLSEKLREHLISEIASRSGLDGIELATELAKNDKSAKVRTDVIESLIFRRADRFAADILKNSSDEVWALIASQGRIDEISDPECAARFQAEKDKYLAAESNLILKIYILLNYAYQSKTSGKEIADLIEAVDLSASQPTDRWTIDKAYEMYPEEVTKALLKRLEANKEMPFRSEDFLQWSEVVIDEGIIVERVLNSEKTDEDFENLDIALSIIGPKTINRLIQNMLEMDAVTRLPEAIHSQELSEKYLSIKDLIIQTNSKSFIEAILNMPLTSDIHEITILVDLIARHGKSGEKQEFDLPPELHRSVIERIETWTKILLESPDANRHDLAEIACAVERVPDENLLPALKELLDADLSRRQIAQAEFEEGLKNGEQINNGARMFYDTQYEKAFSAIGTPKAADILKPYLSHLDFGPDAATALRKIWKKQQISTEEDYRFYSYPDFSAVKQNRELKSLGEPKENHPYIEDILIVVSQLLEGEATEQNQRLALRLAKIAFSMPCNGKQEIIARLLKLPLPAAAKQEFLTMLIMSGEIVSADLILQGIEELFETEKDPKKAWMIHENDNRNLRSWLILLPYSDRPSALLDIWDKIKEKTPNLSKPSNSRDLLSALGQSPSKEAENILEKLAQSEPAFLNEYNWLSALMKHDTLSAAKILLKFILNNSSPDKPRSINRSEFAKKLGLALSKYPELRDEVYQSYLKSSGITKDILEYAISEAPDVKGITILINECGAVGRNLRHTRLYSAIQNITIGKRKSKHWIGAYDQYSIPSQELKKAIFQIINSGTAQKSSLATECLMLIDEFRDDYGPAESDLRHPDIESGIAWPQLPIPASITGKD